MFEEKRVKWVITQSSFLLSKNLMTDGFKFPDAVSAWMIFVTTTKNNNFQLAVAISMAVILGNMHVHSKTETFNDQIKERGMFIGDHILWSSTARVGWQFILQYLHLQSRFSTDPTVVYLLYYSISRIQPLIFSPTFSNV